MPPMNFFDGAIKMVDGEMIFEEGKLENARFAGAKAIAADTDKIESDEPKVMIGELTLPGKGFRLSIPAHLKDTMAGKVGQHVVLGVRPEHFHMRPVDGAGQSALRLKLNVIEPLGNDMDLYLSSPLSDHVVARVEAEQGLAVGSEATLYVDTRRIHFFEPGETGMNLSLSGNIAENRHALA
jgi:ABC-type sugar transport system ATPase subunit